MITAAPLLQSLEQFVKGSFAAAEANDRYILNQFSLEREFLHFVIQEKRHIDCLILQATPPLMPLLNQLWEQDILLPALILVPAPQRAVETAAAPDETATATNFSTSPEPAMARLDHLSLEMRYHDATLMLSTDRLEQLDDAIEQAINQFLALSTVSQPVDSAETDSVMAVTTGSTLMLQQRRLSEKLQERLGYLGVYYKRNPRNFLRHMTQPQRQEFLEQLKADYREIILSYFSRTTTNLNQKIDNFVNLAFFADVSVPQIVEIHMALMDEFSKQLILEGRNDDVLLDYRLTLIDTIAHLCEMYRRSIPRES